ncbi:hypothetical protein WR25_03284 [Diploscapter pachys]|uniref:Uncharacterized protein n=1 Tax=Diploscapter pachys TaxID=2018661 RepID=A0A2A2JQJ2_9BILA|nr:hypothetical protein WR25_03284 [Diploscapter pachys]
MGSSNLDKAAKLLSDSSSNSSSIASTISSSINSNSSLLTSTASSLSQALSTTLSSIANSTSVASSTRAAVNSTAAVSVPVTVSPTSSLPSSASSPQPSFSQATQASVSVPSASSPIHDDGTNSSVALISIVLFLVAVALVMKIVYSRRKKAQWINGTARWRMGNSQLSGGVPQTTTNYSPMDRNGLDTPNQDSRIDWERQFFDESEQSVSRNIGKQTEADFRPERKNI